MTRLLIPALAIGICCAANAQDCPPNIDFETGTFDSWSCYTGSVADVAGTNQMSLYSSGPVSGRHTLFNRTASNELDPYGKFPVVCPNGSGYSIRLGNNTAGTEAEGVSYQFTIPANRDAYSLIYHYAVVFQDPAHLEHQQPRLELEIMNVTDNTIISCSSFTFYPIGSPLPGFFLAENSIGSTPVWCKDWSAVSINLDGMAGKTIRLFFKTADCTFRRHFGYAYIDVNTECSSEFTGATYCRGDSAINVVAPYGYQNYTWYNADFSRVLGSTQNLVMNPPPAAGTMLAVKVEPYYGYGCTDTLYANLIDTLTVKAFAGPDKGICFGSPAQIGGLPRQGIYYEWSPQQGLSETTISNPFANPPQTTTYTLTSRSYGGGCMARDEVMVSPVLVDNSITLLGKDKYCVGYGDSSVLKVLPSDAIRWFRNETALSGANDVVYRVKESGEYYAEVENDGCTAVTPRQNIVIESPRKGITYPPMYVVANNPVNLQARDFGNVLLWRPGTNLSSTTSVNTNFSGTTDQFYNIEITTDAGCVTVDSLAVTIVSKMDIMVPTAFTPNSDGRNDVLRPVLYGMRELRYFRVYNRWGQLLFETRQQHQGWDGKFAGKVQANQVVVWVAEGIGYNDQRLVRKGNTVLIQ
ncbi:gliding motility-associated C-terminal domain-containing protein [Flavisolibacter sp. BT320]|nr:gliding motility-associated C-terminal domain-containing protein [Flavisolibacter longurius]